MLFMSLWQSEIVFSKFFFPLSRFHTKTLLNRLIYYGRGRMSPRKHSPRKRFFFYRIESIIAFCRTGKQQIYVSVWFSSNYFDFKCCHSRKTCVSRVLTTSRDFTSLLLLSTSLFFLPRFTFLGCFSASSGECSERKWISHSIRYEIN